jgi:hypothetical protein
MRMAFLFTCAAVLAVLSTGCGCGPSDPEPANEEHLTPEQRTRWEKIRREADAALQESGAGPGSYLCIVGKRADTGRWGSWGAKNGQEQWLDGMPHYFMSGKGQQVSLGYPRYTPEEAKEKASKLAGSPSVTCTATVDLFGPPNPTLDWFFYDDGKGVKEYPTPPKAEWAHELFAFLYGLQKNPD